MRRIGYLLLGYLLSLQAATASPITVACNLADTTIYATRFVEVDQFVYDVEAQTVDMRSAKTMGTSDYVNWLFSNRKTDLSDDAFALRGGVDWFVGGGVYSGYPYAMRLTPSGALTVSFIQGTEAHVMRWSCSF